MSGRTWAVDYAAFDALASAMESFPERSERAVNEVLATTGADEVVRSIDALMPVSGRRFKGHSAPAKGSKWQRILPGNLSVTVTTVTKRHYLYFPDDGSNTRRHAGGQAFFYRGAQAASTAVVEQITTKITEEWSQ